MKRHNQKWHHPDKRYIQNYIQKQVKLFGHGTRRLIDSLFHPKNDSKESTGDGLTKIIQILTLYTTHFAKTYKEVYFSLNTERTMRKESRQHHLQIAQSLYLTNSRKHFRRQSWAKLILEWIHGKQVNFLKGFTANKQISSMNSQQTSQSLQWVHSNQVNLLWRFML